MQMENEVRYWSILGNAENRENRLMGVLIVVVIAAVGIIGFLANNNNDLNKQIAYLKDKQYMIGIPNANGMFVSTNTIPEKIIENHANSIVVNCTNYDKSSAKDNIEQCRNSMAQPLQIEMHAEFERTLKRANNQYLAEFYVPKYKKLNKVEGGYEYRTRGILRKVQGTKVYAELPYDVAVKFKQGQPTSYRPLGLTVVELDKKKHIRGRKS